MLEEFDDNENNEGGFIKKARNIKKGILNKRGMGKVTQLVTITSNILEN